MDVDISDLITKQMIGASFLGAFFPALFGVIGFYSSKQIQRNLKHQNAVFKMESWLSKLLGIVSDSSYLLEKLDRALTYSDSEKNPITINWTIFESLPRRSEQLQEELASLPIMNGLESLDHSIRKFNNVLDTISLGYSEIRAAFIQKIIEKEQFEILASDLRSVIELTVHYYPTIRDETIKLLAQASLEKKRCKSKLYQFCSWFKICGVREEYNPKDLEEEIKKVKLLIEKVRQASQEKLDEIYGSSTTLS